MDNNNRDQNIQPPVIFDAEFAGAADWARLYRRCGIQVVPACSHLEVKPGSSWKRPLFRSWVEFQEALVPDDKFAEWYGPQGLYATRLNMGVICGRASDGLFVIDLDTHKYRTADLWWTGLLAIHNNDIPLETVEQRTGGGGFQKLFRAPPGWTPPTCKTPIGVDIRGQGGFAMLAPSLHESGKSYEWLDGYSPNEIAIAIAPDWLLDAVDALVREHGGGATSGHHVRTVDPVSAYDAFGHQVDGREELMRDLVWAAVLDWRRECPIKPSEAESLAKEEEKYEVYERQVSPRTTDPVMNKAQLLDFEGRGPGAFHVKWQAAMRRWDDKVAEEARLPGKPYGENSKIGESFLLNDPAKSLILTSKQFADTLKPPAYIIDGIIQRGFLYSLTARTGHGKTAVIMRACAAIVRGEDFAGCSTKRGSVLFFAGENPQDVRARYVAMCDTLRLDTNTASFYFVDGRIDIEANLTRIRAEAEAIPDLRLIVVDTAAAYFPGDDGNSNAQLARYAGLLRQLTFLPSLPTGIVNCHPVKNAASDNLLPMGGSAFVNEVDGNLTLWADDDRATTLHWQGKFRGPEFNPVSFELKEITSQRVVDEFGNLMPTIMAVHMQDTVADRRQESAEEDQNVVLRLMHAERMASFSTIAKNSGFSKSKVQRIVRRLKEDALVKKYRNSRFSVTKKGCIAAGIPVGDDNE